MDNALVFSSTIGKQEDGTVAFSCRFQLKVDGEVLEKPCYYLNPDVCASAGANKNTSDREKGKETVHCTQYCIHCTCIIWSCQPSSKVVIQY